MKRLVLVICVLIATVLASILIGAVIRYDRRKGLFDQPFARSFAEPRKCAGASSIT